MCVKIVRNLYISQCMHVCVYTGTHINRNMYKKYNFYVYDRKTKIKTDV